MVGTVRAEGLRQEDGGRGKGGCEGGRGACVVVRVACSVVDDVGLVSCERSGNLNRL